MNNKIKKWGDALILGILLVILTIFSVRIEEMRQASIPEWTLGQYVDESGNQGLFYTLHNNKSGTLIVIDGGWDVNASKVRRVINEYGGHVDAWFITHFHNDHVSAFNMIYKDPQGITIDKIYDSPFDWNVYQEVAQEWDNPQFYGEYLEITQNATNITHLNRDDVLEIDGLTITIYSTYDDYMLENITGDIPNNGSLLFRVQGKEDSILFCGDCYDDNYGNLLVGKYGDSLCSDYVQLGHHGNNSLPTSFYDVVDPKVAFFDAPEWVMTGEIYDADNLNQYLLSNGIETYDYRTGNHFFDFE